MLEPILTRTPVEDSALTPLPIDEDIASLTAILLDYVYCNALVDNTRAVDGVAVLDERLLIPFKVKAHLDLAAPCDRGEPNDQKTVREHRADVSQLLQLLANEERIALPQVIAADMTAFVAEVEANRDIQLKNIGHAGDVSVQTTRLRAIYCVVAA